MLFNKKVKTQTGFLKIARKYNLPIIIDGGVRKGSDIIKYIALGADLIGIGRPAIYGLIANGKNGVQNVIDILREDLYCAMRNAGIKNIKSINKKILR